MNTLEKELIKELKPIKQKSLKLISGLGTAPEPFNSVKELKQVARDKYKSRRLKRRS
jgi:hypothetical protein